jgi:hypothetical protein
MAWLISPCLTRLCQPGLCPLSCPWRAIHPLSDPFDLPSLAFLAFLTSFASIVEQAGRSFSPSTPSPVSLFPYFSSFCFEFPAREIEAKETEQINPKQSFSQNKIP